MGTYMNICPADVNYSIYEKKHAKCERTNEKKLLLSCPEEERGTTLVISFMFLFKGHRIHMVVTSASLLS